MSHWLLAFFILGDVCAVGLSIYSGIVQHRANKRMEQAIKDLHESHDELHSVIGRFNGRKS